MTVKRNDPAVPVPGTELVFTRLLAAPRRLVFTLWTDPVHLAQWWGPTGFTNPICRAEARSGGALYIVMRAPDGTEYPMSGMFLEVDAPEKIVFTSAALDAKGEPMFEILNTVTFTEEAGQTTQTVRARLLRSGPGAETYLAGMNEGWKLTLDRLEAQATATKQQATAEQKKSPTADREIVVTRLLNAPRALVFAVWTDPQHLDKWWGPKGFRNTTQEANIKPGGLWRFIMHGPDGADYKNCIRFREITPPERITYAHVGEDDAGNAPVHFETVVTFAEEDGQTRVTLRALFPSAEARNFAADKYGAVEGAHQNLDRFAEHVAAQAGPSANEIVNTRLIAVPRAKVFRAWTDPQLLAQWWGPDGFRNTFHEFDPRPGGHWKFIMHGPDGRDYPNESQFVEVTPGRIVLDHVCAPEFRVIATFEERGDKTFVTFRMIFDTAEKCARIKVYAAEANEQNFNRLEAVLAKMA